MHDIFDPRTWEDLPATRRIYLTPCAEVWALVDARDWDFLMSFGVWQLHGCGKGKFYAKNERYGGGRRERVYMHRVIAKLRLKQPRGRFEEHPLVDHIDGDGLNNTLANLRWATHVQNVRNVRGSSARARLVQARESLSMGSGASPPA